jgi:hypothetical protein
MEFDAGCADGRFSVQEANEEDFVPALPHLTSEGGHGVQMTSSGECGKCDSHVGGLYEGVYLI